MRTHLLHQSTGVLSSPSLSLAIPHVLLSDLYYSLNMVGGVDLLAMFDGWLVGIPEYAKLARILHA